VKVSGFLQSLEGYQEYSILVDDGEVFKEFPKDMEEPNVVTLKRNGEEYARVWYCTGDRSLTTTGLQYRNFRLRIRNFAVGRLGAYDDEDGSAYGIVGMQTLGSPTHLNWHVGEIHVTNPDIRPDTPRSSLELDALSRQAIEAIREFYEDRIADSRARSEFKKYQKQIAECETSLKGGTIEEATARTLYSQLEEQERLTRGRAPTQKVKKRVRELLKKSDIKGKRQSLLKKLSTYVAALGKKGNARASENDAKESTAKNNGKGKGAAKTTASTSTEPGLMDVDWEQLLSEVIAAVEAKIPEDDDLRVEVCTAIQDVFEKKGLLLTERE
jgi:hypothetical protein